jgi:hypothetical protein
MHEFIGISLYLCVCLKITIMKAGKKEGSKKEGSPENNFITKVYYKSNLLDCTDLHLFLPLHSFIHQMFTMW